MKKVVFILGLVLVSMTFQSCTDEAQQAEELHIQSNDPDNDGTCDDDEQESGEE